MPGLQFDVLELRYDARTAQLSYRPDLLDDLLAWNEADGELSSAALYELLIACYAQWRSEDGWRNAAMEASLAAEIPVQMIRLEPRYPSLLQRMSMAAQRWLGLSDVSADGCETA